MEMGRKVLGVNKMTTREAIQGELGLNRLSSRRVLLRLRFWSKLITLTDKTRLVYQIYKKRRQDFVRAGKKDKKNWCYWTWKYLKELGLEHIWESEDLERLGKKNFDSLVKTVIERKEEQDWIERMKQKPKLRLYRKLKDRLVLEDYVIKFERGRRKFFTRLRCGTNHLRIERGRWVGEREEERVCNVCLSNEVENEIHYLLRCPMYVKERVKMFEKIRQECKLEYVESMNEDWQLGVLIGQGLRNNRDKIQNTVMEYMKNANKIRKIYG